MHGYFIPITVLKKENHETWHLDISKFNLSELIELRSLLVGDSETGVRAIDSIIAINSHKTNTYYRECKKMVKDDRRRIKMKQIKSENRRRNRRYDKY